MPGVKVDAGGGFVGTAKAASAILLVVSTTIAAVRGVTSTSLVAVSLTFLGSERVGKGIIVGVS
jgi:hypothetical protein